jgi:hypothetical protein
MAVHRAQRKLREGYGVSSQSTERPTPEEQLRSVWATSELAFGIWIREVADGYATCGLNLEAAASLVGATPAELEAVLQLSLLEDDELGLFESVPPKTTWFLFAGASPAGIRAGLDALKSRGTVSAFDVVADAIREAQGPTEQERVAALSWQVFAHAAKKAEQYNQLTDRHRRALKGFGSRKRGGRPLTGAQVAYATGLLAELADAGVISRKSMDGDQELCDQVLDALGRA